MTSDSGATRSRGPGRAFAWIPAILLLLASCTSTEKQEEPQGPPEAPDPEETAGDLPEEPGAGDQEAQPALVLPPPTGRTDVCILVNGDRLTGDIKELESGRLRFKTDRLQTIYIDWVAIARLTSVNWFRFELEDGTYHLGALTEPVRSGMLRVVGERTVDLEMIDVVMIHPSEKTFWDRVDGSISAGIDFTRSTEIAKYDFFLDVEHQTAEDAWALRVNSSATTRESGDTLNRNELNLGYRYYLGNRYFIGGGGTLFNNEEQGIDLRTSLTMTAGRNLIQSNRKKLLFAWGLSGNREFAAGNAEPTNNLEAVAMVEHRLFWYDHPEMDMTNDVSVYPNITSWGRVRVTGNSRIRWELFTDFYWEFRFWLNYDSDPPTDGALKADYGLVTSLGYSF